MALTVLGLLIVIGVVVKVMTGEERAHTSRHVIEFLREVKHAARRRPDEQVFHDAINERSRWPLVTLTLVAFNAVIFLLMLFGPGSLRDPNTLLRWGGSVGPRTTNGEWWRIGTSMFVHAGLFQFVVFTGALLQVGWLLERLVGRARFAAAFFTAGILAGLVNLSAHRATVGFGASGAVSGIYGLLLACLIWCRFHHADVTIPRTTLKRLVPVTVLFLCYGLASDSLAGTAELTGLAVGFIGGLASMIGTSDLRLSPRRMAAVMATGLLIAVAGAIPLRGIADIRPELERIVAFEDQSAGSFQAADGKFKRRLITADALATLIDQSIVAGLVASEARLQAIRNVPQEHAQMLADASEYLRLRSESWRLRAEGLRHIELRTLQASRDTESVPAANWRRRAESQHRTNLATLGNADGKARAALVVLERIRTTTRS